MNRGADEQPAVFLAPNGLFNVVRDPVLTNPFLIVGDFLLSAADRIRTSIRAWDRPAYR
jgi:hypothetical protein